MCASALDVEKFRQIWKKAHFYIVVFAVAAVVGTLYYRSLTPNDIALIYPKTVEIFPEFSAWASGATFGVVPHGILFAIYVTLSFAIFAIVLRLPLALLATFIIMTSPWSLSMMVPAVLRDYSKAPLILAIVWLLSQLVTTRVDARRVMTLAAAAGVTVGVGFWFRQDLVIFVVPIAATILLFLPGGFARTVVLRIAAAALFLGLAISLMSQASSRSVSNSGRNAMAGFMATNTQNLGLAPARYDWGHLFLDEFVDTVVKVQSLADRPGRPVDNLDAAGRGNIARIVLNFPADVMARALASTGGILNLPFSYALAPAGVDLPVLRAFYRLRGGVLGILSGFGPAIVFVAVLILSLCGQLRLALFASALVLLVGSYPALLFHGRHYFHLEFISLLASGFILQCIWDGITTWRRRSRWEAPDWRKASVFLSAAAALAGVFEVARVHQNSHVKEILRQTLNAAQDRLSLVVQVAQGGTVRLSARELSASAIPERMAYLIATFSKSCGAEMVWPVFRYDYTTLRQDFSRAMGIELRDGADTMVLIPAYWGEGSQFAGIDLPQAQSACLTGLASVKDPGKLPIVFWAALPPGWQGEPAYQRFRWEAGYRYSVPSMSRERLASLQNGRFDPIKASDIVFAADIVRRIGEKIEIYGFGQPGPRVDELGSRTPNAPNHELKNSTLIDLSVLRVESDLIRTRATPRKKGTYFVAEGTLNQGGFRVGLVGTEATAAWVDVTAPGPFRIAIEVPADGDYWLGISNDLEFYTSLENRFVIDRAGWVE